MKYFFVKHTPTAETQRDWPDMNETISGGILL